MLFVSCGPPYWSRLRPSTKYTVDRRGLLGKGCLMTDGVFSEMSPSSVKNTSPTSEDSMSVRLFTSNVAKPQPKLGRDRLAVCSEGGNVSTSPLKAQCSGGGSLRGWNRRPAEGRWSRKAPASAGCSVGSVAPSHESHQGFTSEPKEERRKQRSGASEAGLAT